MLRAFVRFSIDGDDGSLTTSMRGLLEQCGFQRIGTGAYEHAAVRVQDLGAALAEFWSAVSDPAAAFPTKSIPPGASFDHIWIYSGAVQ